MKEKEDLPPSTIDADAMGKTLEGIRSPLATERPSNPNASDGIEIDKAKMLHAWKAMTDVQHQLVDVVERNEGEQIKTRKDNQETREDVKNRTRMIATMLVVTCALALLSSAWFARRMYELKVIATNAEKSLEKSTEQIQVNTALIRDSLEVLRRQSKLLAKTIEDDPFTDKQVLSEAISLQASALQAEKKAATLAKEKPSVNVAKEMKRLRAKAKKHKLALDVPLD